jgi:Reverse transcriptase (RNA-dependent DNA polymerase)
MSRRPIAIGPMLSRPVRWEVVPKPGGGERCLVVTSRVDELAFSRSVGGVAPAIRRALAKESHADRVIASDPTRGPIFEPWRSARRRWRREVRRLGGDSRYVVVTDVRACYPSISPGVVTDRLRELGVPEACIHDIGSWLHVFRDAGVEGLPVGPAASALLADAVLSAGDDAIRATGVAHVRWVDDVTIFAPDARTRTAALEVLRRAWASHGLELHDDKTVFLEGSDAMAYLGTAANSPAGSSALR